MRVGSNMTQTAEPVHPGATLNLAPRTSGAGYSSRHLTDNRLQTSFSPKDPVIRLDKQIRCHWKCEFQTDSYRSPARAMPVPHFSCPQLADQDENAARPSRLKTLTTLSSNVLQGISDS